MKMFLQITEEQCQEYVWHPHVFFSLCFVITSPKKPPLIKTSSFTCQMCFVLQVTNVSSSCVGMQRTAATAWTWCCLNSCVKFLLPQEMMKVELKSQPLFLLKIFDGFIYSRFTDSITVNSYASNTSTHMHSSFADSWLLGRLKDSSVLILIFPITATSINVATVTYRLPCSSE